VTVSPLPGTAGVGSPVAMLERPTTAQRVADVLRERVLHGELRSGTQVAELQLSAALGVSRNTLREAFQILIGERLLVHEPHRGVFVRRLRTPDVRDIYTFRRLVECAALAHPVQSAHSAHAGHSAHDAGSPDLSDLAAAVADGRAAARRRAWHEVGTADVRFHVAVTALGGSERLDQVMRSLFAELRLAFQLVPDPRALHRPFLARNAEILALADQGDHERSSRRMRSYLDAAEAQIVAAVESG